MTPRKRPTWCCYRGSKCGVGTLTVFIASKTTVGISPFASWTPKASPNRSCANGPMSIIAPVVHPPECYRELAKSYGLH